MAAGGQETPTENLNFLNPQLENPPTNILFLFFIFVFLISFYSIKIHPFSIQMFPKSDVQQFVVYIQSYCGRSKLFK